ncbi:unnamed protein product, partial [Ectocarpus sp. 8 AP-2014]
DGAGSSLKVARVGDESAVVQGEGTREVAGAGGGNKRLCTFYLKGRCDKGEACTFSHDVERKNCRWVRPCC